MSTLTLSYRRYADRAWQPSTGHLVMLLTTWYQRSRQRRQLAELSGDQLRDIGVSRVQALAESTKPFWQA
jgi:uncharacterized protein YjiS (DUF1127 family)